MGLIMSKKLSLITLASFIISIIAGFVVPEFCTSIAFVGTIYVNLLKVMIIPVLFTSIVDALAHNTKNASKITLTSIITFIVMFVVSFLLCSGLWAVLKPGVGFNFTEVEWGGELVNTTFADFCLNFFPTNIITAMSNNTILPVILFAFIFGIALRNTGCDASFITTLSKGFNKMLSYIMYITPLGVFALMSNTVAVYGSTSILTAIKYVAAAYAGCILIELVVMLLPVWLITKINPIEYLKKVYRIWLITLSTCSSAATLPSTIVVCNKEFNIPDSITNIVVPLGCTIHMCGGAVSFSLLAMFNMQMLGIPMTFSTFIIMIVAALLINMGAPGIPGGGIVIGASYLSLLGVPLTFIGFYAGIYRLLDMAYTTMNVTGDITANILVDKFINEKNK